VAEPDASASHFAPRAAWAETGDAAPPVHPHGDRQRGDLLAATLATLAWANIDPSGYAATWNTVLMIRSGTRGLADSWQGCVKPPGSRRSRRWSGPRSSGRARRVLSRRACRASRCGGWRPMSGRPFRGGAP